uniref:Secreted protein n=1 Tax=Anopheles merus TaxID=30066 RepID=A0A182UWH0_ANOME
MLMMMLMPLLSALATAAHCRCTRILRHTCGATTEQRTSPPTHAADAAKVPVARDDAGCRGTIVPCRARLAAATGTIVILKHKHRDINGRPQQQQQKNGPALRSRARRWISVESNRTKSTFDFFTVLLHGTRLAGVLPPSLAAPSSMVATPGAGSVLPLPSGLVMVPARAFRDTRSLDERWRVSLAFADDSETADGEDGTAPATGGSGDEGIDRIRSDTFLPLLPLKGFGCSAGSGACGSLSYTSSIAVLRIGLCNAPARMHDQ